MFNSLRQQSLIYILDKADKPTLKIGNVISVSAPQPRFGATNPYAEQVVDISVKTDSGNLEFKQMPSMATAANFGSMIISETKEGISAEVEGMLRNSKQVIESIEKHKEVVAECEKLLVELNPQYAKDQARDTRLNKLEEALDDIKAMLSKSLNAKNAKS